MDNDPEPVQDQKKEKSLNELLTSSIVDIYVGPESTHWPLHERLLCYHSPFLANIFYNEHDKNNQSTDNKSSSRKSKSYGFPDEEDYTFTLLVGWLYSNTIPTPKTEKDVGPLLDLYLLSQKLEIDRLSTDVVDATREYYYTSSTYPGLRRVQYIYGNTDEDNEMREMMVSCVARQLTTTEQIPAHWASALQRNGQLAVDIIRSIQRWNIEERSIPDIRDGSISGGRGRKGKGGFSAIVREGESLETETTGMTGSVSLGSNLGVESVASEETGHADEGMIHGPDSGTPSVSEAGKEGNRDGEAEFFTLSSLSLIQAHLKQPPAIDNPNHLDRDKVQTWRDQGQQQHRLQEPGQAVGHDKSQGKHYRPGPRRKRRTSSVSFNPVPDIMPAPPVTVIEDEDKEEDEDEDKDKDREVHQGQDQNKDNTARGRVDVRRDRASLAQQTRLVFRVLFRRWEMLFLMLLWGCYFVWFFGLVGLGDWRRSEV